jgi:hypothetical protein
LPTNSIATPARTPIFTRRSQVRRDLRAALRGDRFAFTRQPHGLDGERSDLLVVGGVRRASG